MTGGDGWDSCHSYCGNGGLTPPVLSTRKSDVHSMPPYGERLGGGAVRPLCRGVASSEAEMTYPLEAEMRCAVEGPEGSPRARRR